MLRPAPAPSTADAHPLLQLLPRCLSLPSLRRLHASLITSGLALHSFPLSRLIAASSRLSPAYSFAIFTGVPRPTIFLFNTLISSLASAAHPSLLAFTLYLSLLSSGLRPNCFTFPSLFKLCGYHRLRDHGRALHAHVLKFLGQPFDRFVVASLVSFYARIGRVDVARHLFDGIKEPDLACWNSMLAAYTRSDIFGLSFGITDVVDGNVAEFSLDALSLFMKMQRSGVMPNEVTLVAVIGACANVGALAQGMWFHKYALAENLDLNVFVATALVDMYSKCGCLDLACKVFSETPRKDSFLYNAMIGGFAVHGHGDRAIELFDKMKNEGLVPNDATFVVTMSACSHVGLVNEGRKVFRSMTEVYGIEPKLEHYGCLVDLLGRRGQLQEALEVVQSMAMKPNAVVWRSLLGAARVYGDMVIGEVALKKLLELEPETSGHYVVLSNIYASIERWADANRVRKLMKQHRVDKAPGHSLVEVDGVMHEFLLGDRKHPNSAEIYLKLDEMNTKLQEHGYRARTGDVLFDIEVEEKEDALFYHSERLAIAFALISVEPGLPIRIIKNLRVCEDCHVVTKLISMIYAREIIVRDRVRFHHIKGGSCSCSDYW